MPVDITSVLCPSVPHDKPFSEIFTLLELAEISARTYEISRMHPKFEGVTGRRIVIRVEGPKLEYLVTDYDEQGNEESYPYVPISTE